MDFSEIIVTIIISLVIIAINALGSKKRNKRLKTSRENDLYKIPNPMRRPMNRGEKLGL